MIDIPATKDTIFSRIPLLRNLSVVSLSHICFHGSVKSGSCYNSRGREAPKKEGRVRVTNVSYAGEHGQAGMSIWHCSNSPMVRSPKTQWGERGERSRTQTFSLSKQKDDSKVERSRRRRSRLTLPGPSKKQ